MTPNSRDTTALRSTARFVTKRRWTKTCQLQKRLDHGIVSCVLIDIYFSNIHSKFGTVLYKVVLTFESVYGILKSDHSNESYWTVQIIFVNYWWPWRMQVLIKINLDCLLTKSSPSTSKNVFGHNERDPASCPVYYYRRNFCAIDGWL